MKSAAKWALWGATCGLGLGLLGCSKSKDASQGDIRRPLLEGLGTEIFVPTYVEFERETAALSVAVLGLCEAPSEATLQAARDAWWSARAPWKRNELLSFGPYADQPLRAGTKIDFWPARPSTIEAVLASDAPALDAEELAGRGTAERGLPVVEYLLWVLPEPTEPVDDGAGGQGGSAPVDSAEPELAEIFASDSRRCEYLAALAGDLEAQATALREAWDPEVGNYLAQLVEAGRDKQFTTVELALGEVVSRLAFTIENIRNDKLGGPLGNRTDGTPQPGSAESRFSGRSLEDVRDNLRGVERVIFGTGEKDATSLATYLKTIEQEALVSDLRKAMDDSYGALDAIGEPLTESVLKSDNHVQAAIDQLAVLQRLIQVDMIHAMNITLTFNDNDGD